MLHEDISFVICSHDCWRHNNGSSAKDKADVQEGCDIKVGYTISNHERMLVLLYCLNDLPIMRRNYTLTLYLSVAELVTHVLFEISNISTSFGLKRARFDNIALSCFRFLSMSRVPRVV